jgi:tight adherence protein C
LIALADSDRASPASGFVDVVQRNQFLESVLPAPLNLQRNSPIIMLPSWFLAAFYVFAALAVTWLVVRMIRKRRGGDANRTARGGLVTPLSEELTPAYARARSPGSWQQRPAATFSNAFSLPNELPRILPEQTPLAGDDDLLFGPLTVGLADLLPETEKRRSELRQELQTAGYYAPHALANLSAVRYLLMMGLLLVGGVLLILVPRRFEPFAIGAIVAGPILGWSLPQLYVRNRAARRKSEIERAMPDLLDMLNMCVSQGLTVPDSLRRILPDLQDVHPAMAQELRIVLEQASLSNLNQALKNFDGRIDLPEVHSFTSLLMQTDRMGTSVSESLTTYSDTMRESLKQRADEKGNRAAFRLLFPTVFCLMPAVYLFLLGPAIIGLSDFFKSGGREQLEQGTRAIERLNTERENAGNRREQLGN